MARPGRTWWGQRFLKALEGFTDEGRLQRGRSYAGPSRILEFGIDKGVVSATVRGNINPYFGVYEEPRYKSRIQLTPIPARDWKAIIAHLGSRAGLVAKLLMDEMPDNIDEALAGLKRHLLPASRKDFKQTQCSCPDYANPCKHIAGLYYRLAAELDREPLLLFELRGLSQERLRRDLRATPLGEALAALLEERDTHIVAAESCHPRPRRRATLPDYERFWHGERRLPAEIEPATPASVPAILVKKGGDPPPFWDRDSSFIDLMEEIYARVRMHHKRTL